ncbi:hypothetical protein [Pseudomonas sp. 5Ae-yellow]|nr:hypothetical protein [Pseudomonas sp. 5Ae-yellow]MBA6421620.1 hypothetical protein [Pseudomonas sp. 5Ae-yellow]
MTKQSNPEQDNPLTLHLGHEELIIRRRYELLSIINDFFMVHRGLAGI